MSLFIQPLSPLFWASVGNIFFTYTTENVAWGMVKHLAAGYLVLSLIGRTRWNKFSSGVVFTALLGSLGPDLIDKPLSLIGILSYGRSFAHSLLTATVILSTIFVFANRGNNSKLGSAFAVGYLSHISVDLFGEVFGGLPYLDTAFLLWPVIIKQPIGIARPALPVATEIIFVVVIVVAAILWIIDGVTGVRETIQFN